MTHKTTMPEPVASRFIEKNHYAAGKNWAYCEPFNPQQDWTKKAQDDYYVVQLYSAFQMEAYANARVREALEAAADVANRVKYKYVYGYSGHEVEAADEIEDVIRTLTPPLRNGNA